MPATNAVPKPLTARCTNSPPTATTPSRTIGGNPSLSSRAAIPDVIGAPAAGGNAGVRRICAPQYASEAHWAITVASATPSTPMSARATSAQSSAMLRSVEITSAISGDRLSPRARSAHAATLYSPVASSPEKTTRR